MKEPPGNQPISQTSNQTASLAVRPSVPPAARSAFRTSIHPSIHIKLTYTLDSGNHNPFQKTLHLIALVAFDQLYVCLTQHHMTSFIPVICIITWQRWKYIHERTPKQYNHNDVIKWKQFPRCWPLMRGIHRSPVNSPHKNQWRGALMVSLLCAWTNGWVSNRDAGSLRRHRATYDVTVMIAMDFQHRSQPSVLWIFVI